MKTKKISRIDFENIAQKSEGHFFDIKSRDIDGRGIQKITVAFANADGGEFVIGVKDKKNALGVMERWDGFTDIEAMSGALQAIFEIKPSAEVNYEFLTCEDAEGYLFRVTVEKSAEVLATGDGRVILRHGAQSLSIKDPARIQELAFSKGATSFEDRGLSGLPTELITDSVEMKEFLSGYSPETDPLYFVINQNLVDYRSWEVRAAAALLFHPTPSAVLPRKCAVKVSRYETREDDPEREHLAEQRTVEGPLYELITQSVKAVTDLMSSVKVWTGGGIGTLDYPPEAVWETIANAIIHRDYSISDDVQIYIFNDRIDIHSPGRLLGYVTVENILDARFSRNTKIVRTLNRYENPPNKDMGEGLNTAFQKMK